jgi:hypothetical protein
VWVKMAEDLHLEHVRLVGRHFMVRRTKFLTKVIYEGGLWSDICCMIGVRQLHLWEEGRGI